mmetsp:Transcript_4435/g.13559  ORF Transcript_4435/g.13559 Transcript_4435/m.13559 type:complete len:372 (-) Transcript_4435:256-1371(-)
MERVVGVVLLVVVCVIWSISSVVVQRVEKEGISAIVLTYLCNTLFAIYLVPRCAGSEREEADEELLDRARPRPKERSVALVLSPLWMFANVTYNASLSATSITSSTILSSTSALWTLGIAVTVGVERGTWAKLFAGVACVAGAALVAWADRDADRGGETVLGDSLALASAALYGAYGTALRYFQPLDNCTLFGYLGIWNALIFALPVALFAALTDAFRSLTPVILALVLAKGLFDNALSDFLWAKALVLTSPTVATVGLSLTIPMAFGIDALTGSLDPAHNSILLRALGSLLVFASFVRVSLFDDQSTLPHNGPAHNKPDEPPDPRRRSDDDDDDLSDDDADLATTTPLHPDGSGPAQPTAPDPPAPCTPA